jgi:hypothetical protein
MCMLAQAFLAVTRVSRGKGTPSRGKARCSAEVGCPAVVDRGDSGLLAATTLLRAVGVAAAIARALWRQVDQTRAMISHYRRRGDLDVGM